MSEFLDKLVDTGLKGIYKREINDGIYVINPKGSKDIALKALDVSNRSYSSVLFSHLEYNADQFFFIKYYDQLDYYTIMSLKYQKFLAINKRENDNYDDENIIIQNLNAKNILTRWQITSDDGFNIELKGTENNICCRKDNSVLLVKKNKSDEQKFNIFPIDIIKTGLYYINSMTPEKSFITFSKENNSEEAFLSGKIQSANQLFYVVFDQRDGCYSIINITDISKDSIKCISPGRNPTKNSQIVQTNFYNLDYQKYIIAINDYKKGIFSIINKSNLLMLCNPQTPGSNQILKLRFTDFDHKEACINTFFQFQHCAHSKLLFFIKKSNEERKIDEFSQQIERKMCLRYQKELIKPMESTGNSKSINDKLFENNFLLEKLDIPLFFANIHENAFINCKRIKYIKCHPKWLKLLPNPSNVENIVVPQNVECIEKEYFENFVNLKYLSLPESLKFNHCDPDAFKNIYGLTKFEGDPIFLRIIHKTELTRVYIPFFVKEISENAFEGCISLREVKFDDNSKLKIIKSCAFSGCPLLRKLSIPESVVNIASDAFKGCNENFEPIYKNDLQKASAEDNLVIEQNVTKITKDYSKYVNITKIDIHLNVQKIESEILKNFRMLKCVCCDPKWLNDFDTEKIETVFIPDSITHLKKHDFDNLIHLKEIEIPESVEEIEESTFENCKELKIIKCGPNHFKRFDQKQITNIYLNEQVKRITLRDFEGFVNLETLTIPKTIRNIRPNVFANCKKLMKIDYPKGESFINNKISIDIYKNEIFKKEFEGWINLKILEIPKSITKIEEGTFDNCTNLEYLVCDPKWFPFIPKNSINKVVIPEYVEVLEKGQFDDFYAMTEIKIPKNITINDPTIFDKCDSLKIIKCSPSVFSKLSDKTIERCDGKIKMEYESPIFNFQPDLSRVHDKTDFFTKSNEDSNLNDLYTTNSLYFSKIGRNKSTTVDDLIHFDSNASKYRKYINKVLMYIRNGDFPRKKKPKDTSLSEITDLCGAIFYNIIKNTHDDLIPDDDDPNPVKIVPRVIQIYAVLRLADELLNYDQKGSIAEIKTGEGKTLVLAILAIILVKYGRTVDIITSNTQLAHRDKHITSKYFDMFNIDTAVFYDKRTDKDLSLSATFSHPKYFEEYKEYNQSEFNNFNLKAFDCPVVYSTNRNFEIYYLHTLFSMIPRKREFDIVLIDEVDNMLIDAIESPSIISKEVNYAFSKHIFCYVYTLRQMKLAEIANLLKKEFPNASDFNEDDIEVLRNAALESDIKIKDVDYIIDKRKIVIIDPNTSAKMQNSHWPNYVYEMVEIKESIVPRQANLSFCQVTQQTYFKLYKNIAGVTGTIGNEIDQQILKTGYNINAFKVPRHYPSKVEIYYKLRPESIDELFELVLKDINKKTSKGRPVLVIWDSKYHADKFKKDKEIEDCQTIDGVSPADDEIAIKNAGNPGVLTIATSAAGRGVDIKLADEVLQNDGLHVIIPMKISNLRSLEQAVGRAARQGQPGSVKIFIAKEDLYVKTLKFCHKNENLDRIQRDFTNYIRQNFCWILCGPRKASFDDQTILPFAANYSDILAILSLRIFFTFKEDIPVSHNKNTKVLNDFQDLAWIMVQTAWGAYFTNLQNDRLNANNQKYCENSFVHFKEELEMYLSPEKSKSITGALDFIKLKYQEHKNKEYIIHKGFSVSENGTKIIPPLKIEENKAKITKAVENSIVKFVNKPLPLVIFTGISLLLPAKYFGNACKSKLKEFAPSKKIKEKSHSRCVCKLDIELIKTAMIFANEAYSGEFSEGNVILSSEINEIYKPKFYCVEYLNKLFVVTRGSNSDEDWLTDFTCTEKCKNINGTEVYFHRGFYKAAKYILSNITDFLERNYEEIYFVGHSYAAAVSNVLCMLTKTQEKFKNKKISSLAFAPPPSMSKIPAYVQECIFSFINRYDIVPHCSLNNIKKTLVCFNIPSKDFIDNLYKRFKSINIGINVTPFNWIKTFIKFMDNHKDHVYKLLDTINNESHVQRNIGNLFHIGLFDTTKLENCIVDENDLPSILFYQDTIDSDHFMLSYIESFKKIKSF